MSNAKKQRNKCGAYERGLCLYLNFLAASKRTVELCSAIRNFIFKKQIGSCEGKSIRDWKRILR
jgi:hypothetical protein